MVNQYDIGTEICLDLGDEVTTSESRKILYKKPSGVVGEWEAVLDTDINVIKYITGEDDIDEAGVWSLQGVAVFDDGMWYSKEVPMLVGEAIKRVEYES